MSTVSTDLARRLQVVGRQREWQQGDWVEHVIEGRCLVLSPDPAAPLVWSVKRRRTRMALTEDCLWLPTGDQCVETIGQKLVSIQRSGWSGEAHGYTLYMVEWDYGDGEIDCAVVEAETLAEATGLALAAVLEEEKDE